MLGNCLVIPRISRTSSTSVTATAILISRTTKGGPMARPSRNSPDCGSLQPGRDLHLPGDDLGAVAVHQVDEGSRDRRVDLADAHAVVLEVEHEVRAALELAGSLLLRDRDHAVVDALHAARQDALREVVLVDVDADAPLAGVIRGLERAETAATGDLEEHVCTL